MPIPPTDIAIDDDPSGTAASIGAPRSADAGLAVAAAGLDRLRKHRARRWDASAIDRIVASIQREASRAQRGTGDFAEAWEAEVPEALRDRCRIHSVRGGVARVEASDASVRYELERLLREGLLLAVRRRFGKPLRRVRVDSAWSRDAGSGPVGRR